MGAWLERVVFSRMGREPLPLHLHDFRTPAGAAARRQLHARLQASCSIPVLLQAVHDIPGAPRGAYWDGGITDYHLHLNYRVARWPARPGAVPALPEDGGARLAGQGLKAPAPVQPPRWTACW
jgi:hypothetical protein